MRKVLSLLVGLGVGAALGVLLVALFSPVSGAQLRANLRQLLLEAVQAAREAQAAKRAELEQQLAEIRRASERAASAPPQPTSTPSA